MIRPESEFSLGKNRENTEVSPTSDNFSYPEIPEIGGEQTTPQSEIPRRQEIVFTSELRSRSETQVEEEVPLGRPQKETLNWFQRKKREVKEAGELLIRKAEEKGMSLTEKDKKKLFSIPVLWTAHALISTFVGNTIGGGSFLSLIRHRDLSLLPPLMLYNLIPGALRLGAIIFTEGHLDVEFSWKSKATALLCGWAMPVEIALMLRERQLLLDEIKKHYFKTPLARVQGVAQKIRRVFKR